MSRRAPPTSQDLPPLLNGKGNFLFNPVNLPLGREWSHLRFFFKRITDADRLRPANHRLQKRIRNTVLQIKPRTRDTTLSRCPENTGN